MELLKVAPESLLALKTFKLPKNVGFGSIMAPVMIDCDYENNKFGPLKMIPYGPISLMPAAKVFHYSQEIFEGLKAYRIEGKGPFLFRPMDNAERFQISARRMAMPEVPVDYFLTAVKGMASYCANLIPEEKGDSLYIRPFLFATEETLGIKPAEKFKFMVVASPSGNYFTKATLPVMIERQRSRACPGGTGTAKTGGNYASGMLTSRDAMKNGFMQTLWLDAVHHQYIEELSGMNFFAVVNGELHTPVLNDTILDGITRKSIIHLAHDMNINVKEVRMSIDELVTQIKKGVCTEAFACGTAAIITPLECLGEKDGTRYSLPAGKSILSKKLKDALLDIQEGRKPGPKGWVVPVELPPL